MKKINLKGALGKGSFGTKSVRYGSYSALLIAIVIVIVVVVNLIASSLPSSIKTVDLSPNKVYSIGSDTEKVLDGLRKNVTITVLSSKESTQDALKELLAKYDDSDKVKVTYSDPTVNVDLANKYSDLSEGSVIVKCGSREQTIDSSSIFATDTSSYYSTGQTSTSFDGEGQITSAIQYVTSSKLPKMYTITGHGETALSSTVSALVKKQNIESEELNLMTSGSIPDDCDLLLINAPTSDYTADEAKLVTDYLDGGGKAMILDNYTDASMTNFNSILEAYGIKVEDGIVLESANHYYQYPMYVIPTIESSDITKDLADDKANILMPNSLAFTQNNADGVDITPLLETSDGAYLKKVTDGQISTTAKEDGDETGQFGIAYLAEKSSGSGKNSKSGELIAVSGASLIDDNVTQSFTLGNLDFFTESLSYLTKDSGASTVSIESKSMTAQTMTVPALQSVVWGAVMVIVIPVAAIVIGLVVWLRRRKK